MKQTLLTYIVAIFFCGELFSSPQNGWHYAGEMPYAVTAGEIVTNDSAIFILGGFADSIFQRVNWIQSFVPPNHWQTVGTMKRTRSRFVADVYDNSALYFGDFNFGSSYDSITKMESAKLTNPYSVKVYDSSRIFTRIFAAGLIQNDNYYIFGGYTFSLSPAASLPYIVEYNIPTRTVTYVNDSLYHNRHLPQGQMIERIGNTIYLFGGEFNSVSSDIFKFNTVTHTYEEVPINLLRPRAYGRAVRISDDEIMILGGKNENSNALRTTEIFKVQPGGYTIRTAPSFVVPRAYLMAEILNGKLYIFGGSDQSQNIVHSIEVYDSTVSVQETNVQPQTFSLAQNFPNPFNPATTIQYTLTSAAMVTLKIYSMEGKEIATVVNRKEQSGEHFVQWSADGWESGIYFYRIVVGEQSATKKMVFIK